MSDIQYRAIGIIHSPFTDPTGAPIQPVAANVAEGTVEVLPELEAALQDLDGFSHLFLLYHFHRAGPFQPVVTPFLDQATHGLFATRAAARPNPIGLSVVELLAVSGSVLRIRGVDVLDGTPLLDIKPYVPDFDSPCSCRTGWLAGRSSLAATLRADSRFSGE